MNVVVTLVVRAMAMFLLGIPILALYIRSGVDYIRYLEVSVGADALKRATDGTNYSWLQDSQLWATARQNYWLDIIAVTTEPRNLLGIACASITLAGLTFAFDFIQSRAPRVV